MLFVTPIATIQIIQVDSFFFPSSTYLLQTLFLMCVCVQSISFDFQFQLLLFD